MIFPLEITGVKPGSVLIETMLSGDPLYHELWTPNEGINQRNLKIKADVADKICFGHT